MTHIYNSLLSLSGQPINKSKNFKILLIRIITKDIKTFDRLTKNNVEYVRRLMGKKYISHKITTDRHEQFLNINQHRSKKTLIKTQQHNHSTLRFSLYFSLHHTLSFQVLQYANAAVINQTLLHKQNQSLILNQPADI